MTDNELSFKIGRAIVTGLAVAVMSIAGCTATRTHIQTRAMVEMVKTGADPLGARCAIDSNSQDQLCTVLAARK